MSLLDQAKAAKEVVDQTEATQGFEFEVAPEGYTTARFVGYVELGKQPQRPYKGKDKPPASEVLLTFELNGKKHITEYEKDGEKKTRTNIVTERLRLSSNEKSGFYKLLNKMAAGRQDIKHMAEMLGEGFLIKIVHNVTEKDGNKKTWVNIKDADGYTVSAPETFDPVSETSTPIEVPAATVAPKLLLQAAPSKEQWESIFIDGTYTRKKGDVEEEVSKNWIQQTCMNATDFVGSALEAFLAGGDDITKELLEGPKETKTDLPETIEEDKSDNETEDKTSSAPAQDDVLSDLGLG